jgi:hypothetical protein
MAIPILNFLSATMAIKMTTKKIINALKNILNNRLNFIVVFSNDLIGIIIIATWWISVPPLEFSCYRNI